jgi:hypothetical protein
MRAVAEAIRDAEARATALLIAEDFDRRAQRAERRSENVIRFPGPRDEGGRNVAGEARLREEHRQAGSRGEIAPAGLQAERPRPVGADPTRPILSAGVVEGGQPHARLALVLAPFAVGAFSLANPDQFTVFMNWLASIIR